MLAGFGCGCFAIFTSPPQPFPALQGRGFCVVGTCEQVAGFGGDGGGGFAAKVGFGELCPKVFEGLRVAGELGFGLFARAVFAGVQAVLVVFELVPGLLVEVVEEAGAPGVPEAGVGGADVGEGQQVEVVEVFGAGDGRGVGGDGVGVGEVFFLRGEAVVEVVGDEPGEQGAVFGRDGVVFARVEVGDLRAGLAVVAVVAFADVVKEGGKVEDGRVFQAGQGFGGFGVGGVGADEAVEGFDEFEGVLVHGVLVEEVVLHPSGDVGEGGDVAVEQAVLVDARQLGVDVAGLGEQGEEGAAVVGVAAARDVGEAVAVAADVAHEVGVRFADGRVLLEVLEEFPRLVGILGEAGWVAQGEFAVLAGVVAG